MDKYKLKTQKSQQIFHFDEHNIEKICTSLENEIEILKVVKIQNQPLKTPDVQLFKTALYETETNTLLELPSLAPSKNISNITKNEIIKTTKYLLSDAVQASRYFQRTQQTQTEAITLEDQSNIASVWILQKEIDNNTPMEKIQKFKSSNNFKKMLFISDRIVTSNNFSKKQIEFITRHTSDKLNAMSYRYTLEEILQFSIDKLTNFSVSSFVWNTINEDILAVGYGKWNDESSGFKGAVCCWSLKNPVYPERMYEFNKPITCLDFSKTKANILVAGSHGGCVYILDIVQEICDPVIVNEKHLQNFPIWSVVSFLQKSYTSEDEFILSVDGNGSVRKWSGGVSKTYNTEQMLLIYCGIRNDAAKPNICKLDYSTIVQNMPGTVISFHPTNKSTYFVGTKVGFIVQNTVDSCNHYDKIFMAHNGPVYGIKFSPFCSSIFITYGADWKIKIWMENVDVPLLSLCYCNAVDDADWSPINSTVIVSVSGAVICIWDFARKTVEPVMMFTCKTGVHFSLVKFSKHGNNIVTGDVNGQVRCFHISNMPSPSFLQKSSILTALENMMSSNHELVQIIKKTMMKK